MPIDPPTLASGLGVLKLAFDGVRSAISMVKEVRSLNSGSKQEQEAIDAALTVATANVAVAEAQLAQAFGYELCRCEFPPTPMLTIGYFNRPMAGKHEGDPVYGCPKCGYCTAGPYGFARIVEAKPIVRQGGSRHD
jgi:hypothetical protein